METDSFFVYFADSRCLQREEVRRFCLRIPEVITELRRAQKESNHEDVFILLWSDEDFHNIDLQEQIFFFNVIQRGLFYRLKKVQSGHFVVLRTKEELQQILDSDMENKEVWLVGPLVDSAAILFMKSGGRLRNILEEDTQLREAFEFSEAPEIQVQ